MKVRQATHADARRIAQIHVETWRVAYEAMGLRLDGATKVEQGLNKQGLNNYEFHEVRYRISI